MMGSIKCSATGDATIAKAEAIEAEAAASGVAVGDTGETAAAAAAAVVTVEAQGRPHVALVEPKSRRTIPTAHGRANYHLMHLWAFHKRMHTMPWPHLPNLGADQHD